MKRKQNVPLLSLPSIVLFLVLLTTPLFAQDADTIYTGFGNDTIMIDVDAISNNQTIVLIDIDGIFTLDFEGMRLSQRNTLECRGILDNSPNQITTTDVSVPFPTGTCFFPGDPYVPNNYLLYVDDRLPNGLGFGRVDCNSEFGANGPFKFLRLFWEDKELKFEYLSSDSGNPVFRTFTIQFAGYEDSIDQTYLSELINTQKVSFNTRDHLWYFDLSEYKRRIEGTFSHAALGDAPYFLVDLQETDLYSDPQDQPEFGVCADGTPSSIFRITLDEPLPVDITLPYRLQIREGQGSSPAERYGSFTLDTSEPSDSYAQFIYQHPENILRPDDRLLTVEVFDESKNEIIDSFSLRIHAPPIAMIHGAFTDSEIFEELEDRLLSSNDHAYIPYQLFRVDYAEDAQLRFAANFGRVSSAIDQLKSNMLFGERVACQEVDIIAHGTGGLMARQYLQFSDYRKDVNRIMTICTPHYGTPMANYLLEDSPFSDLLICPLFDVSLFDCPAPIWNDLKVNSSFIRNTINGATANRVVIPTHLFAASERSSLAIVGQDLGLALVNVVVSLIGNKLKIPETAIDVFAALVEIAPESTWFILRRYSFEDAANDRISPISSQVSNMVPAYWTMINTIDYFEVMESESLLNKIDFLLRQSIQYPEYGLNGFFPGQLTYDNYQDSDVIDSLDQLSILSPASGGQFPAGSAIPVEVEFRTVMRNTNDSVDMTILVQNEGGDIIYRNTFEGEKANDQILPDSLELGPHHLITFAYDKANQRYAMDTSSFFYVDSLSTSIVELNQPQKDLDVFPNPASTTITLSAPTLQNQRYTYELHDVLGKKVKQGTLNPINETLDISDLQQGVYTITLQYHKRKSTAILMKI